MAVEKLSSSFVDMRQQFVEEVSKAFVNGDISCIKAKWTSFEARDLEKRAALEQALKDKTMQLMTESINDPFKLAKFLNLIMALCKQELAFAVLSVSLLSDILDSATIPVCEQLFEFVEGHVGTWKTPHFFGSCKNNILRMCNDLLRRLSKAQNTVFCGRILLFLAMYFPFSERSGLNVVSEFNVDKDNFMKYEVEFEETEEEPLQPSEIPLNLDSIFYSQFWALQEFFRSPTLCYNKNQWKEFVKNTEAVLTVLKNIKLEWEPNTSVEVTKKHQTFFTKFLTNQKLLLLQLSDTDFTRTIYLQFLILFQFFSAQVKTKPEELKADQLEWVKNTTATIHQLIKASPPNGEKFLEVVQLIIMREEHWNQWKNDGCPALKKVMPNYDKTAVQKPPEVPRTVADVMAEQKNTNLFAVLKKKGDEDVTEVIDMRQNYLQYLPGRNVSPNVHEFLAESIKQSENADMEAKEKKVNDPQFAWIALKLLSMKSPHFFSTNQDRAPPPTKLPDFVDHICRRIFREQNPGMLLPPLHPAPKAVEAAKDQIVEKRQKVVKTANAKTVQGKAVGTAKAGDQAAKAAKTVKAPAPQNAEKAPVAKSDAKTTDKTEKLVKNDKQEKPDRIDRYEQNEKSERYEKGKSEKQEAAKLVKTEKAKTPVGDRSSTREKTIERKNDVEKNSVPKVSEKERTTPSRKERERSPGKRKREIDAVEIISNKKTARERRDDRRDEKNDDAPSLTTEQIEKLSKSISGSWKKVAEKLGFKSDDIEYFATKDTDYERALNVLLNWTDFDDATTENLYRCLRSLNLTDAMKILV
ncbi:THO complex subunit [Nesidiocoris tenuis]|uniref:THO complex subunit n=1 Tax=Nesidiocoris tenuis TaxID=355587 RepID=A0ABN7AMM7_9HEMI|nr:THO complex subunit [Nesidiocoris tenuis]